MKPYTGRRIYICGTCHGDAEPDGIGLYCRTCQQDVPYPLPADDDDGGTDDYRDD